VARVRYAHNPIRCALTVSLMLSSELLLHYESGEIALELRRLASKFNEMACAWLDVVIHSESNWKQRWQLVLTASSEAYPLDCIEIALDINLYEFLSHPMVVRFIDDAWMGNARELIEYNFSVPDVFKIMECVLRSGASAERGERGAGGARSGARQVGGCEAGRARSGASAKRG
jgi:hypothetical protein